MATLSGNINTQNIVDRFSDYVTSTSNSGIEWGTNNLPFPEFSSSTFGGTTAGRPISISGPNIDSSGSNITASNIYNTLVAETNQCTKIHHLRAILFVTGDGGNTGSRPTPGTVFDQTKVSYLTNTNSIGSPNNGGVSTGNNVTVTSLENLFDNLRSSYNTKRSITNTVQVDVCHSSCHSSCHGSRSRR